MKYAWTVEGDDPDFVKGDEYGINGYFYPMFDPVTTQEQLLATIHRGHAAGLYMASNWEMFKDKTPAEIAAIVSTEYNRLRKKNNTVILPTLKMQFDMEEHEPDKIISTLEGFRSRQQLAGTSWTMEGMQGGWIKAHPTFVSRLLALRVRVVPQGYWGAAGKIEGYWAEDQILRNLTRAGIPESIVSLFYDARELPRGWDGYAFTIGRLP